MAVGECFLSSARPAVTGPLPDDYAERVYAGVLGKLIGVYLGRPIEGWHYERIMKEVGEVDHYLKALNGAPLVVTDDDVTGTFTFLRALEDEGYPADLPADKIGDNWLNYTIERRTIFWWGGVGNSTEHTAYQRLKSGVRAPMSGSRELNGKVISEQIGSQIFIDGWAMVAPGDPAFAADLARRAASVSHDGEAIYGAQVIAAMEAQAFVESDLNKLIDTALQFIPADSVIARSIADVRAWHKAEPDWRKARELLEANYGYDKYLGACHMVPNHALIILSLLYGESDFRKSQMIVNTSGWDTDCNAANVGCILGIKDGLSTLEGQYDWRGPVADRMYLSSADGGRGITDAVIETDRIVAAGHALRGQEYEAPKGGAKFTFGYPGSVQGFEVDGGGGGTLANPTGNALEITPVGGTIRVLTPTFIPEEALAMPGYLLFASPTLYPGQKLTANVTASGAAKVTLVARIYNAQDEQEMISGPAIDIAAGATGSLNWTLPDTNGLPINAIGFEVSGAAVSVDSIDWRGSPEVTFARPENRNAAIWRRQFVDAVDHFEGQYFEAFRISSNDSRGIVSVGTRDWVDYTVHSTIMPYLAKNVGIAARIQGLRRYYALVLGSDQNLRIIKRDDVQETVLAEAPAKLDVFQPVTFVLTVAGDRLTGFAAGVTISATDADSRLTSGGAGFVIEEGTMGSEAITIGASAPKDPSAGTVATGSGLNIEEGAVGH